MHACIGEGNGHPLQCSCLENPRDGGAWWPAIYGVAQSQTRLKWLSSSNTILFIYLFIKKIFFSSAAYFLKQTKKIWKSQKRDNTERERERERSPVLTLIQSPKFIWIFPVLYPVYVCVHVHVCIKFCATLSSMQIQGSTTTVKMFNSSNNTKVLSFIIIPSSLPSLTPGNLLSPFLKQSIQKCYINEIIQWVIFDTGFFHST